MFSNVMIDIETLGTRPTAPVLQIGAIAFNLHSMETASLTVCCEPDLDKYSCDYSTFKFWMAQSDVARGGLFRDTLPLREGLDALITFLITTGAKDAAIWANPAKFDLPIIENAFKVEGLPVPWKYDSDACLRTLCKLAKLPKSERVVARIPHDALSDCEAQVATLRLALQKLAMTDAP